MSEVIAPIAGPPRGLAMGPDAHERMGRIEAARDALRLARTPPPPLPSAGVPLPPSFEEALIARAGFAAAHAPPPPPPPPPPVTPAPATVDLWAGEADDALRGAASDYPTPLDLASATRAADVPGEARADPFVEWIPTAAQSPEPARPVVVDPERLAADPRGVLSAEVIEALRSRHLGDMPLRPESGEARP